MNENTELVDLQKTLYESKNPTRRWLHCSRRDWIFAQLDARSGDGVDKALEIGPGSGIYLPELAKVAREVVAADIEEAYLEHARAMEQTLPSLRCVLDDITNSSLPENAFDLILCTEVIEHIADSPAALRGLTARLAPGGTLILSTPQRYSPLEICAKVAFLPVVIDVVRMIYGEAILETGHINLLTERQLREQIDAADLEITTTHKSGFYLPLIAEFMGQSGQKLLESLESRLLPSPASGLLWTQYYVLNKRGTH